MDDPRAAVVVEEQGRVDAVDIGQPHRVRPRPRRIARRQQIIAAAADARVEQVEDAVVPAEVGRIDPLPHVGLVELELARAVDGIADLGPVDEVAAVEDRNSGEPAEGRVCEVDNRCRREARSGRDKSPAGSGWNIGWRPDAGRRRRDNRTSRSAPAGALPIAGAATISSQGPRRGYAWRDAPARAAAIAWRNSLGRNWRS